MSLEKLKKAQSSSLSKIQEEINKINSKTEKQSDTRFWQPTKDSAGNAVASIRFLPAVEGESLPWVEVFNHAFKVDSTNRWYIENSLTTLGQKDPVTEANSILWNSGVEANKKLASSRKRRLRYISNILVIKDSAKPENDGKVFLFSYGKKVFDKVKAQMFPDKNDIDEVKAINPFCPWTGANFKLKVKVVEGYPNYDDCSFYPQSSIFDGDDKKIEEMYKKEYALAEFVDIKNFKSYDDLKKKLDWALGETTPHEQAKQVEKVKTEVASKVVESSAVVDASNDESEEDYLNALMKDAGV